MTTDKQQEPKGLLVEFNIQEDLIKNGNIIVTVNGERYFHLPCWYKEAVNGKLIEFTPQEMCSIAPDFTKTFMQPTEDQLEWIRNNLQPEDIFPQSELERAARALGMEYNDKN